MSDLADSSCCCRQLEVCRSLLVMPLSFVFRGNNCTPRSFQEKSHITDATDPPMLWTYFSTSPSRKFEWQTSGDNSKQWVVIDGACEIRPSVLIWDGFSLRSWKRTLITIYLGNLTFNKSNYCKLRSSAFHFYGLIDGSADLLSSVCSIFLDGVSHFQAYAYQRHLSAILFCNINTSCAEPQIENCCIHLQPTFHLVRSNIYSLYKYWTCVRERCEDARWCAKHSQNVFSRRRVKM